MVIYFRCARQTMYNGIISLKHFFLCHMINVISSVYYIFLWQWLFDQINILVKILIITVLNLKEINLHTNVLSGADPGFQVRGAHLEKLRRAEGDAKISGYFVWKITILRQKNPPPPPLPGSVPDYNRTNDRTYLYIWNSGKGQCQRIRAVIAVPHLAVTVRSTMNIGIGDGS